MSGLGDRARRAVTWNFAFNLFRDGLQFGTMLVLVRMLEPAAYGQFALVVSIIGFVSIVSQNSFLAHSLQPRDDAEVDYQLHFTAGLFLQGAAFIVANLVATALWFLDTYRAVAPLVHVLSLTFLLEWPCELRRKMLERALDWRRLRLLHGLGLILGAALAVGLAAAGAGVYALVLPGMAAALPFMFDLLVSQRWRPDWRWSWPSYRPTWRFGLARSASAAISLTRPLLENGAIVHLLGFAAAGIFGRAAGLATILVGKMTAQLLYALYPVLTRMENGGPSARRAAGLVLRFVAWTAVPLGCVFSMLSLPAVALVYGDRWTEVADLLPWTMAGGVVGAVYHATYMINLANDASRSCLIADVACVFSVIISLLLLLPLSLKYYLTGAVIGQSLALAYLTLQLVRSGSLVWSDLITALCIPIIASAIAASIIANVFALSTPEPRELIPALTYAAIFLALYVAVIRLVNADKLKELIALCPASRLMARIMLLRSAV